MLPEKIQIDITTYCNSHCGGCIRNNDGGEACVDLVHLPFEIFKKIDFKNVQVIYFNGAYGDFSMHPNILKIIDSIPKYVNVDASTNGGARNTDWWKQLAIVLKKFRKSRVTFAIDGISTNHLYRRGVDTEKVLEHAQVFIDAGGDARWKCVAFEHNQFELKRASDLARKMGFHRFQVVESYAQEIYQKQYKAFPEHVAKKVKINDNYTWSSKHLELFNPANDKHRCAWRNERAIQIDAWGNIWQCCYMPAIRTVPDVYKELQLFELKNNLHKYSYHEILNSDVFVELFDEPLELCKNCKEYV